jgi:hypothetical protein
VRVADDITDAGEGGKFFRGALRVAAGNDNACGGVLLVKFAYGVAGLGVGGLRDGASVDDDDIGSLTRSGKGAAAAHELTFDGSTVSLGGTAAELFDVKGRHKDQFTVCSSEFEADTRWVTEKRDAEPSHFLFQPHDPKQSFLKLFEFRLSFVFFLGAVVQRFFERDQVPTKFKLSQNQSTQGFQRFLLFRTELAGILINHAQSAKGKPVFGD